MRIDIYQDLICPWCYIGSHRFKRALASRPGLEPDIVWQPFQLNPTMPATGVERQIYLTAKFGGKERAAEVYQIVAETAAADDLPLRLDLIRRTPNTLDAHRLVRLVASEGGNVQTAVDTLFTAYFVDGLDIGDLDVLVAIADRLGLDTAEVREYLTGDEDTAAVLAIDAAARQRGIQAVPCFIFDRQFAVSGAQEPDVFQPLFDVAAIAADAPAL